MVENYVNKIALVGFGFLMIFGIKLNAQESNVQIDMNCQRFLGDVSELDRTKYFSQHDSSSDSEATTFRNDYNVTGGRGFWGAFSYAKSKTGAVGVYPSYKNGNTSVKEVTKGQIGTEHPKNTFIDGINISLGADWVVEYYKDFVDKSGRPEYYEIMNEPFVHASDFYTGNWSSSENDRIKLQMAQLYGEVGKRVKETPELSNMKIIGYSSAWPSMELNNFGHWQENMKMFMDTAGENMYGFATHLYDGINVTGQDSKRSGSNSEAILDLIEAYSYIKWGQIKPHAISEYGAIEKGYGDDYSDIASVQTVSSINHILFNLLDRENNLTVSIPFITGKATWHITEANNYQPYGAVLWKPTVIGVPLSTSTAWEYTPRIYFYELWKEVKGKRVQIKSDNPDVQTHAFVEGKKLFVAISNLDSQNQKVNLNMLSSEGTLQNVRIKDLKIYLQNEPIFTNEVVTTAPEYVNLIPDETIILEYNFSSNIEFDNALRTKKYYTSTYLKPISANTAISFNFSNVTSGVGFANLRMSIGRKHNVSKKPIVKVNGAVVEVPANWAGYDQAARDDFFGMIDIPFSSNLLQENNIVTVEFPDNGGTISSLILTVENFDITDNTLGIETIGNSCRGTENGQIVITPFVSDSFKLDLSGNNLNKTLDFNSKITINNLAAGSYSLIITNTNEPSFKEEYNLAITEPENLAVQSKVDKVSKTVDLELKGSVVYQISLNGFSFTTRKSSISLPLEKGKNKIEVKAENDCQGIYNENLIIGSEIIVYPNPSSHNFNIDLGLDNSTEATIAIYSTLGNLVYSQNYKVQNGKVLLNTASLQNGIYILSVKTENSSKKLKIIKH